jgi:hypothetical protein
MWATRLAAVGLGVLGVLVGALVGIGQDNLGLAGPGDPLKLSLLRLPAVQKELELTPEQNATIATLSEQTKEAKKEIESASGKVKGQPKVQDAGPNGNGAGGAGFNSEIFEAGLSALEQKTEEALRKLLNVKQRTRLAQIALRAEGPGAFVKPELIRALNLGQDQVAIVQEILDGLRTANEQYKESQKQSAALTKDLGDSPDLEKLQKDQQKGQTRTRAYTQSKQAMAQIAKILTRRQRDNYNKLLGPPFDFVKLADAKGQPLFGGETDLAATLARQPAVLEELELNEEQKARIAAGETPLKVLDKRQRARLNQIALQSEGPAAFTRPDVQRTLRLDQTQIDDIATVLTDVTEATRQLRESQKAAFARQGADAAPGDPAQEKVRKEQDKEKRRSAAAGLRKGVMEQINGILTRPQKETFAKMLGAPFNFAALKREPPKVKDAN